MKNLSEIQPKSATEALRLARTEEKASAILAAGYLFDLDKETEIVNVVKPDSSLPSYTINLSDDTDLYPQGCSCPDYQNRGSYCKHTLAWATWKKTVARWKRTFHATTGTYTLETFTEDELEAEACEMSLECYLRWKELSEDPFVIFA